LRDAVRDEEPLKLLDMLLVGALIEARSCERFARLAPRLPERLARFYGGLLASESRHFEHYLEFARSETGVSQADLDTRLAELKRIEAQLVTEPDSEFRFHSGPPAAR
jgi:tRNA-(ms[2]io[6]A)-hydroxylase